MMQIVSSIGAAVVMFAYGMLQVEKWKPTSWPYLVLNLAGSCLLFWAAVVARDPGWMVLNLFWGIITVGTIWRSR